MDWIKLWTSRLDWIGLGQQQWARVQLWVKSRCMWLEMKLELRHLLAGVDRKQTSTIGEWVGRRHHVVAVTGRKQFAFVVVVVSVVARWQNYRVVVSRGAPKNNAQWRIKAVPAIPHHQPRSWGKLKVIWTLVNRLLVKLIIRPIYRLWTDVDINLTSYCSALHRNSCANFVVFSLRGYNISSLRSRRRCIDVIFYLIVFLLRFCLLFDYYYCCFYAEDFRTKLPCIFQSRFATFSISTSWLGLP